MAVPLEKSFVYTASKDESVKIVPCQNSFVKKLTEKEPITEALSPSEFKNISQQKLFSETQSFVCQDII